MNIDWSTICLSSTPLESQRSLTLNEWHWRTQVESRAVGSDWSHLMKKSYYINTRPMKATPCTWTTLSSHRKKHLMIDHNTTQITNYHIQTSARYLTHLKSNKSTLRAVIKSQSSAIWPRREWYLARRQTTPPQTTRTVQHLITAKQVLHPKVLVAGQTFNYEERKMTWLTCGGGGK